MNRGQRVPVVAGGALLGFSLGTFAAGLLGAGLPPVTGWLPLPAMAMLAAYASWQFGRRTELAEWERTLGARAPGRISVNVSPRELHEPGFAAGVGALLAAAGPAARCWCRLLSPVALTS